MSGLQSALLGGGVGIKYWVSGTTYAQGDNARSPTDHQLYVRIVAGAGTTDPASDATNWRPDGARAIKSIQRGVLSMSATSATATISSVNTAKSELRFLGGGALDSGNFPCFPLVTLTNSTTITGSTNGTPAPNIKIGWELTEYY